MSSPVAAPPRGRPPALDVVPVRHPGRAAAAGVVVVLLAFFCYGAATNEAYDWPTYGRYVFDERISQAALVTVVLTVLSMIIGVLLGVVLAVMRLSPNPVLAWISWGVLWVFRGTPVYVQLVFWGLLSTIYKTMTIGWWTLDSNVVFGNPFWLAVVGLGLNEAAYMAEIVRAGLGSVDEGQREAATVLGLSWWQTMSRVVLPQAMRVIIPPTGNELISMLKTTSLVTAVPYTLDLYSRTRDLSVETFNPVPMLLIACTWYLAFTSVLMIGQHYLERYFSRGAAKAAAARRLAEVPVTELGTGGDGR